MSGIAAGAAEAAEAAETAEDHEISDEVFKQVSEEMDEARAQKEDKGGGDVVAIGLGVFVDGGRVVGRLRRWQQQYPYGESFRDVFSPRSRSKYPIPARALFEMLVNCCGRSLR